MPAKQASEDAGTSSCPAFEYFSLFRMKLSADKSNMTVTTKYDHYFAAGLSEPMMFWVEEKSGRVLGCIEDRVKLSEGEALALFAVIYANRKFVPLRFRARSELGGFRLKEAKPVRIGTLNSREGWMEWNRKLSSYWWSVEPYYWQPHLLGPRTEWRSCASDAYN